MFFPNIIAFSTIAGMATALYHVANAFAPTMLSASLATIQAALGL